ncbi:hypothetical protein OG948_57300 (plasmid) [Embleya sp. NBC_00888]|uniref:hypothetical protein n=1 Tax=Embleya sp. NBC_00888 TaxID=2975960 RepID=UPI002F90FEF5|nr:hypothetical protein OG948_57300 [Embleya sp. NBC_00888]
MTGWVLAWDGSPSNLDATKHGVGSRFRWSMGRNFSPAEAPQPDEPYLLWRADYRAKTQIVVSQGVVVRGQYTLQGTRFLHLRVEQAVPVTVPRTVLHADDVLTDKGSFVDCGIFDSKRRNRGKNPYRLSDREWHSLAAIVARYAAPTGGMP